MTPVSFLSNSLQTLKFEHTAIVGYPSVAFPYPSTICIRSPKWTAPNGSLPVVSLHSINLLVSLWNQIVSFFPLIHTNHTNEPVKPPLAPFTHRQPSTVYLLVSYTTV